jgi:spore coat protein A
MHMNRRSFLKLSAASTAAAFMATRARFLRGANAAQSPQIPLPGSAIPQFIDPVPNLLDADHLIVDDGVNQITLEMKEHLVNMLPAGTVPGYQGTYAWSYLLPSQAARPSYIGPVVLAKRGIPTEMKFVNLLGHTADTNVLAYKYSTDQTLHWADPLNNEANMWNHMAMPPAFGSEGAANYDGPIPAVVHLHGGEVPPVLDGGPDAWFTSDGLYHGHAYYSKAGALGNEAIYRYPNSQEGALIWFHDHTLGATRLNVYCGLAGAYLIADPSDTLLANLPTLFPLVIQDRMFDTSGQLFFPADSAGGVLWTTNPEHPYWVPEFVGDTIVVNGKAWPFMSVEPKRYTFLFINGSNARTYEMALVDPISKQAGPPLWVIGTDGGYLDAPVKIDPLAPANNVLAMMSGERYWVIVDFANYQAGMTGNLGLPYSGTWLLKNNAKTPYPAGAAPQGSTVGRIMQFRVGALTAPDTSFDPALPGVTLRPTPMVRLTGATVQKTRQLTLNEVMGMPVNAIDPVTNAMTAYPGGPLEILVNNTKWGGERITGVDANGMFTMEPIPGFTLDGTGKNWLSELPKEGETEIWEIVNLTADAHPIHLHLVQFQLLNRQNFNVNTYMAAYNAAFPAGYDYVMGMNVGPGLFIPGFGPPLDYNTGNVRALGGNPDIAATKKGGKPIYLQGPAMPPLPQEAGWKDTVIMFPGQVTRILVRWAPTDISVGTAPANANFPFDPNGGHGYVWHCHIVDHEDNEMMRPDEVVPIGGTIGSVTNPGTPPTRTYEKDVDY